MATETRGPADGDADGNSLGSAVVRNPTVQTLGVMAIVSALGWAIAPGSAPVSFTVSPPIGDPWYELVMANYAHLNSAHLYANVVVISVAGGIVSLSTTAVRFHGFFLTTGIVSSIAQVAVSSVLGQPVAVLGSSGAAFALVGYILIANPVSLPVLKRLNTRVVAVVLFLLGSAITLRYSAPGSAVFSHFVGVMLGLGAGRFRLLAIRD